MNLLTSKLKKYESFNGRSLIDRRPLTTAAPITNYKTIRKEVGEMSRATQFIERSENDKWGFFWGKLMVLKLENPREWDDCVGILSRTTRSTVKAILCR